MKHLSEEQLIDLNYGELAPRTALRHLRSCGQCTEAYTRLKQDLEVFSSTEVPLRGEQYGEQIWRSIRSSLPRYANPPRRRIPGSLWKGLVCTVACLLIAAIAFFSGRHWQRRTLPGQQSAQSASSAAMQQLVLAAMLTDHLERTERLLIELRHVDSDNTAESSQLQAQARELLAANRLYRATAAQSDDPELTGALDQLERILVEVADQPDELSQADLNRIHDEMNAEGILFEIRILLSKTPEHTSGTTREKGVSL